MHADSLPITGPCPIDLDAIGFDREGRVSHCTHCRKSVHILSNMTKEEARGFLRDNRGKKLCISYARDAKGHIRFRESAPIAARAPAPASEPSIVPLHRLRTRRSRTAGLAAALGVSAALAACTPTEPPEESRDVAVEVPRATHESPERRESGRSFADVVSEHVERARQQPPRPVVDVPPDPIVEIPEPLPLAGAAMIPEVMVEGEIEVPDPGVVDSEEPCDPKAKAGSIAARTL